MIHVLLYIAIFVGFYFLVIRPGKKNYDAWTEEEKKAWRERSISYSYNEDSGSYFTSTNSILASRRGDD